MNIDDAVILQKALGPCKPGAEGIIKHIDDQRNLVVEITHDHQCNPFNFLLPPVPADYYKAGSNCS